jgi:hypothetical protein
VFMVYGMAFVKLEFRFRFPHHNVSVVTRQNRSLREPVPRHSQYGHTTFSDITRLVEYSQYLVLLPCELSWLLAPP